MAAGLGFKDFTTGEVLTAADVDGYLMQGIWVFANAAARDAAVTSPQEGNCCYLKDTDAVQTYSGTAWVGFDDSNAIQNSIVDAKGDIVAASGNDTPARLAVGNNGETLVADSSTSTGLRWEGNYAAGKNKIINGNFNIWQRGTSFTPASNVVIYSADRFTGYATFSAGTYTVSQQAFTAGTAPVAGYENQYFLRHSFPTSGTISYAEFGQKIEDVRTFAGQTVTLSFWAKASSAITSPTFTITQNFGSGGSSSVSTGSYAPTFSTSWTRYSVTITLPSISGKTIGTNSFLFVQFFTGSVATSTVLDFWGFQLEAGSVATAFQTATGTIQGELAACQRYYQKSYDQATSPGAAVVLGWVDMIVGTNTTNTLRANVRFPVQMRAIPTITLFDAAGTSGKVFKGANGKTGTATDIGSAGFTGGTNDATSTNEIAYQYTAEAEL